MRSLQFAFVMPAVLAAILGAAPPSRAATFTVDTTVDDPAATACTDAAPNDCSLRGAIIKANGLSEASTIVVPAGTYVLSQATSCTFRTHQFGDFDVNTTALCIGADVTLIGAGAASTIIDGNLLGRVFLVGNKVVEIQGVTLKNGTVPSNTPASYLGSLAFGGAINNGGSLTLVDSVILESSSVLNGGAISNGHSLTVLRTTIARNTSGDGGGIANISYFEVTTLAVLDSSISSNRALNGYGGGIHNFYGVVIVSGSTISGNDANNLGGGIFSNGTGVLTVTNSTISGNTGGSEGGGVFNNQSSVADLNNVTVTNNFAARDGGGIYNEGPFTVANTLIAGNRAPGELSGPDCSGSFISTGYNLIQNVSYNCQLTGDTTGNVIGQDPRLGVLTDNGGATPTHALGNGSPAIDAGSPASPGSGGAACAAYDQRGFLRPLGAACDIGAFERSAAFSVSKIQPSSSGNAGSASVLVSGNGFLPGATVQLTRSGQPAIVGDPVQADVGGSAIAATFDLTGRPTGPWDVVVLNPDSTSQTLPAGFTIEAGGAPDLWVDVIGLTRREGPSTMTIFYGNRGKVDALAVPLQISVSGQFGLTVLFSIAQPPSQPDQRLTDFSQVPVTVQADAQNSYTNLPLLLPVVPAGFTGMLQIVLEPPPTTASTLFVNIDTPYFKPSLDSQIVSSLVQAAVAYAPVGFNVTIPSTLVPGLEQYVRNQLQLVVDRGRSVFVGSLGSTPLIYSHAQLQMDAAIVGAVRALH